MRGVEDNIKTDLRELGWGYAFDLSGSGQGTVADSRGQGNEPSGSIKGGEFLNWLSVLPASQEGRCSME
jgi:hypothetical protein